MKQSDFERFRAIMAGMGRMYEREVDATMLDAYWIALRSWSLEDFETGAALLMSKSEFMPRPANFAKLRSAGKPTAAEAWDSVLKHCKGAYRDGSGLDNGGPIDTAVRGLGGYKTIAFQNLDYLPIVQRQFVELFEDASVTIETREAVPKITSAQHSTLKLNTDGPRHVSEFLPKRST